MSHRCDGCGESLDPCRCQIFEELRSVNARLDAAEKTIRDVLRDPACSDYIAQKYIEQNIGNATALHKEEPSDETDQRRLIKTGNPFLELQKKEST